MKPPLLLAICTVAVQIHHPSQAAQITLSPLSGQVSLDPGSWTVSHQTQMIALIVKGQPVSAYPIMEYALEAVPEGVVLTSATLTFPAWSPTRGALSFRGYPGNGRLDRDDFMHGESALGGCDSVLEQREYAVTLALPYIQSLLDVSATHLGIVVSQQVYDVSTRITSPQLTLTYIPEPAALVLFTISGVAVTARRRS